MKLVNALVLSGMLTSCGGKESGSTTPTENPCGANPCGENPCGANPCGAPAGGEAPTDVGANWSSWESWQKVNAEPFKSDGHQKPWVNVYVPPQHAEAYASLAAEMPEGFAIVKSAHEEAGGPAKNLTVMAKMGPDYDPENNNWYYAVLSADGSRAMQQGKMEMCINCHASAENDYLFGTKK